MNFAKRKTSLSEDNPSLIDDSPNFAGGRANVAQSEDNPSFTKVKQITPKAAPVSLEVNKRQQRSCENKVVFDLNL
ncbi:uncharacterized protein A4U43_C07F31640 [Asparagus officinalis]|uniref:Uncharacterized protein n=1 Tax=Asparagus officinalis TaxID=4686 RepID=A0A5P1EGB2_ASPOF|nr:uncharacterized protein A4U43_C07F31640 [Asparagus officinalis]